MGSIVEVRVLRFGRYQIDPVQGLRLDGAEVKVTPKALSVLRVLAERSGEVVTKDQIFSLVWTDTAVSDAALTSCIQELRQALHDDARHPRFIETLHRRGYRFLPALLPAVPDARLPLPASAPREDTIVGRDAVFRLLADDCARAESGRRQLLLLAGEPGVGKTTVVQAFVTQAAGRINAASAQCVEHYGMGEPYQPLLEALMRLCSRPERSDVVASLEQHAPTWLAQLPGLLSADRLAALQRATTGTTRERMLRELTGALEAMTAKAPLILWLDDLQWSDVSTLDWIAAFAQRPEPARCLLIGTLRSSALRDPQHPLAALAEMLRIRQFCREVVLDGLSEAAVAEWLARRYPAPPDQALEHRRLATLVHRHTAGNPLFVVNVLSDLVARGLFVPDDGGWRLTADLAGLDLGIPEDVRRVIERQVERLPAEHQALLEAGAVAGAAFPAATVARVTGRGLDDVESALGALAHRRHFIRDTGAIAWPDGTVTTGFEFEHALYRTVLYRGMPSGRRAERHRQIAVCLEAAWGARAPEISAELAMHFEEGHDFARATAYRQHAAENARRRNAAIEARAHYLKALSLLAAVPPGRERDEREVALQIGLGGMAMVTQGWGSAEAEQAYSRARGLCATLGNDPRRFQALWGLWLFYWGRGRLATADEIARELLDIATGARDRARLLQAHHAAWATTFAQGRLEATQAHAREGIAVYDMAQHADMAALYGSHDVGVCARSFHARALALAGRAADAARTIDEAMELAARLAHPFTEALTLVFAAAVRQSLRDGPGTSRHAAAALRIAREQDFRLLGAWAAGFDGWARIESGDVTEGLRLLADAVAAMKATASAQFQTHFLALLAEGCLRNRQPAKADAVLDEAAAAVRDTGERFYEAEIHRLRGELMLASGRAHASAEAEDQFQNAITVARAQGAQLLTLRAAISLARAWRLTPRSREGRALLASALAELGGDPPPADAADAAALLGSPAEASD